MWVSNELILMNTHNIVLNYEHTEIKNYPFLIACSTVISFTDIFSFYFESVHYVMSIGRYDFLFPHKR